MDILIKSVTFVGRNTRFMKKIFIFLTLAITFGIQNVIAVPAYKGTVKIKQPDGTTVTISLHGDEYMNFYTTEDGYSITKNGEGGYVYAELKNGQLLPTARIAHDINERSLSEKTYLDGVKKYLAPQMKKNAAEEKNRELSRRAQTLQKTHNRSAQYDYNNFRGLIILVEFNDKSFSRSDYDSIANDIANAENYSGFSTQYPFTGSVRDYFNDISGGLFKPEFDVVGPVKINRSQYYPKQTEKASQVVYDALNAADSKVNFSDYDRDGDGMVDMIYFIFAGFGSNFGGSDERLIWPHAGQVYNPQTYNYVKKDGVWLGRYACSTELYGPSTIGQNIIDGIGTICHEFSHVLGLPDFYDTDYERSGGQSNHPDDWDIMASGSYHNYSRTPVGYTLYERSAIGFAEPILIDSEGTFTLQNVSNNTGYRLNTRQNNEYFLLENRQKDKWNLYAPGHGMLVFRVDRTNVGVWNDNKVNVNPEHNYFELLRAGGVQGSASSSDPFPGNKKVRKLNNTTSPANLKTWAGKHSPWGLDNITEVNGVISFDVVDINVLTSVKIPDSVSVNVGLDYALTVECYPVEAPCSLTWTSSNEAVATVDENGVVKGVSSGTATITVKANNNDNLTDSCLVVVKDINEYANIVTFKSSVEGSIGKLLLSNAQVLFAHDNILYIRDSTGCVSLVNAGLDVKSNDVLDGFIAGQSKIDNDIVQLFALEGVDNKANITITEGDVVEPRTIIVDEVNSSLYSDLVMITGAEMVSSTVNGLKGVFVSGDSVSVRIFNTFGLSKNELTMPKSYAGKKFDLTGILLNTVSNGNVIYELALVKSPTESQTINGITQTLNESLQKVVYTLDGRRVQNMTKPGFYIIHQGQEKRKVFIK